MAKTESVRIALTCADGALVVMTFVTAEYRSDGAARWMRLPTRAAVDAEITRAATTFDPGKTPIQGWRFIEEADLPPDRTYRNAWRDRNGRIEHDMPHARNLHRDLLREARAPQMVALDEAYLRADEAGDVAAKQRVAVRKQRLRDAPSDPRIEAAQTPEALKLITLPEDA